MLFDQLLLHDIDIEILSKYIVKPSGSILLVAPKGFGKQTLAQSLATQIVPTAARDTFVKELMPNDKNVITVEAAREIKDFFKLKTLSPNDKRVVIIHKSETMTDEAQNTLLKIIEEPPKNCFFIMTTHASTELLPTILSRVWLYTLKTPPKSQVITYTQNLGYHTQDIEKALYLTDGLPALTCSILEGKSTELTMSINEAKLVLSNTVFDRLCLVDSLAKDRQKSIDLVESLLKVSNGALLITLDKQKPADAWQKIVKKLLEARTKLEQNAVTKLVLTDLMLSL